MANKRTSIIIKSPNDVARMRPACRLAAQTLNMIEKHIKPGITTDHLNSLCHDFIVQNGAYPSPLNYRGFPKSICTSINHVVCHGIPSNKKLRNGDIINVDVTVFLDDFHGDTSRTFFVGTPSDKARKIVDVARQSLLAGIFAVRPRATLGDIGFAIQTLAEKQKCSVVRDFCGHGIGHQFHEEPQVLHVGKAGKGLVLQEGMVFTIEPMINLGKYATKTLADGWTAITRDRSLSAQFEHTLLVTATGVEILTNWDI
ncbi:MAG: type I methionyl aminopeptidase [Mariprofundales bacterium]